MKPHPAYKPSGVAWVNKLPFDWSIKKIKFIAPLVGERADGVRNGTRYVGLEHVQSGTGRFVEATDDLQSEAESTVNVFSKGDVLFGKLRPYLAKSVVANTDGACSSEFLVLRPEKDVDSRYLNWTLLLESVTKAIDASTFGAKMPRADWGFIGQLRLPMPPLNEQQAIVEYLDDEVGRIDKLIREKEDLIELLQEARTSVFGAVLLRHIDRRSAKQISRFPWLPYMPATWLTLKIKHVTTSVDQGISPQCEAHPPDEGQWGVLKVGCVNTGDFDPEESKALPANIEPIANIILARGDVVISRANTKSLVGRAAMVDRDYPQLMLSDKLYRLKLDVERCEPAFLVYVLALPAVRARIEGRATGASASMLNIDRRTILDLDLPLPPLSVQHRVVDDVKAERESIANLIAHTNAEISLLNELRAATIADAVLGRIDVRTANSAGDQRMGSNNPSV